METRTISILPTSIDPRRAYYTIHGDVKYMTKKVRLSDFELLNEGQKPIYFGPKGIYSLIKSIQFLNREGNIIDAMYNTDYMAIKMLHPSNQKQRDINRILFQNAGLSVDAHSPSISLSAGLSVSLSPVPCPPPGFSQSLSLLSPWSSDIEAGETLTVR